MPRAKALPGPSRLSQIIRSLNQSPKPLLPSLKSLKLTLAAKNDHFGARFFAKEDLPRIQYVNPGLMVHVDKCPRSAEDTWRAEMLLEFKNGSKTTLDVSEKWSTAILEELMERAGGDRWQVYKAERRAAGREPTIPTVKARSPHIQQSPPATNRAGVASALP